MTSLEEQVRQRIQQARDRRIFARLEKILCSKAIRTMGEIITSKCKITLPDASVYTNWIEYFERGALHIGRHMISSETSNGVYVEYKEIRVFDGRGEDWIVTYIPGKWEEELDILYGKVERIEEPLIAQALLEKQKELRGRFGL